MTIALSPGALTFPSSTRRSGVVPAQPACSPTPHGCRQQSTGPLPCLHPCPHRSPERATPQALTPRAGFCAGMAGAAAGH